MAGDWLQVGAHGTWLTDCVRVCPSITRAGTWHSGFRALYSSDSYTHAATQQKELVERCSSRARHSCACGTCCPPSFTRFTALYSYSIPFNARAATKCNTQ